MVYDKCLEREYWIDVVKRVQAERDSLKDQLASMTKRTEVAERCVANYVEMMRGTMRALGIDPSKEQNR